MRDLVQALLAGLKFGTKDCVLLAILAAVNIPTHIFLARLFFDGWEGLKEAVCFLFTRISFQSLPTNTSTTSGPRQNWACSSFCVLPSGSADSPSSQKYFID